MYDQPLMVLVSGLVLGIILVIIKLIYDDWKMKKEIEEQNSKMIRMYHPSSGFVRVAKTEKEMIESMIRDYGWSIVEKNEFQS